MPRLSVHPVPKKRFHGGRWRIYWKWNHQQYSVATDYTDQKKSVAVNVDLRLFSAALAMEHPAFPEAYREAPAVVTYLNVRYPVTEISATPDDSAWLDDYAREIAGECSPKWAAMSIVYLRALEKDAGGLAGLTPEGASKFLAGIAVNHKTATRNRLLAIFSRFYKWAVRTERTTVNPFAGIKTLKEERLSDIVYCTPAERDEAIDFARATEWPEWLAIPIALYAGMRREEIANLLWPDKGEVFTSARFAQAVAHPEGFVIRELPDALAGNASCKSDEAHEIVRPERHIFFRVVDDGAAAVGSVERVFFSQREKGAHRQSKAGGCLFKRPEESRNLRCRMP